MIYTRQINNVVAVKDDLVLQPLNILPDFIVFNHNHDQINAFKEFVQIVILILHQILLDPRIINLQRLAKMLSLVIEKLQRGRLSIVINIFFEG